MPRTFVNLAVHIIFSTKHRQPWIAEEIAPRLYSYIGGIARSERAVLDRAGGVEDHVHLLLSLPATLSVADANRIIKTNSSKWIHDTYPALRAFGWQDGYAAFSVSLSNMEAVRRYIDGQREHHRTMSFRDELVMFLRKHGIEFEPMHLD